MNVAKMLLDGKQKLIHCYKMYEYSSSVFLLNTIEATLINITLFSLTGLLLYFSSVLFLGTCALLWSLTPSMPTSLLKLEPYSASLFDIAHDPILDAASSLYTGGANPSAAWSGVLGMSK